MRTRTVPFSFSQLYRWRLRLEQQLPPSTVFTDVDEAQNKVVIGVEGETDRAALLAHGAGLGIPPLAFEAVVVPPIKLAARLDTRNRPLHGGMQVSYRARRANGTVAVATCSMAMPVRRFMDDNWAGFLTASHCTPTTFGISDPEDIQQAEFYQGGNAVSDRVGYEEEDPLAFSEYDDYHCPSGKRCRWSDAAFIRYAFSQTEPLYVSRAVARPVAPAASFPRDLTPIYATPFTAFRSSGLYVGDSLLKIGHRTGYTHGRVTNTCLNIAVSFRDNYDGVERSWMILCAGKSTNLVNQGDSGGIVFRASPNHPDYIFAEGIVTGLQDGLMVFSTCAGIRRDFPSMDSPCHQ